MFGMKYLRLNVNFQWAVGESASLGIDLTTKDPDGNTPIHYAVLEGYVEAIEILAKATEGTCLGVHDKDGETPWEVAKRVGSEEVIAYIGEHWKDYAELRTPNLDVTVQEADWLGGIITWDLVPAGGKNSIGMEL